ncbi:SCO family protein [Castellaniella hirudinis]|uniref:SCO family protein n=1 Tax=Castellaniella hirudinis TaxID=1144617 RepID=UPI0039C0B427
MRWVFALVLSLVAGVGALYGLTSGFTALTAETARRQAIAARPQVLPPVRVLDAAGGVLPLQQDLRRDGRVAIVNFFYTRCNALCLAQGSLTEQLQQAIRAEGLQDKIRLISLSFDARDRADDLARYGARMGADPGIWQFLTLTEADSRQALLDQFGLVVVPAPLGEFEHNAALHLVTPDGRLVRIFDLDEPGLALKTAQALADSPRPAVSEGPS